MKVLFAVSDENISESIVREYQKQYREIITYKNVYYFNAIIKELQKDKTYDRIVVSEDLEPFVSNNFDTIDKFIFEKLDKISDEAINDNGTDTQIIVITTDRRNFGDGMLLKFFGIGVYSALIGKDKSIENVCELIKKPRTKKEAKQYYKIDADDVNYKAESENDVSETEIKNILAHYKKIGQEKYVSSFDDIVAQYNDAQLRIIINFLPVGVKAVLESESPKYQELVMTAKPAAKTKKVETTSYEPPKVKSTYKEKTAQKMPSISEKDLKIDMLENRNKTNLSKPVVIPTELEQKPIRKITTPKPQVQQPQVEEFEIEQPKIQQSQVQQPRVQQPVARDEDAPITVRIEDLDELDDYDDDYEDVVEENTNTNIDIEEDNDVVEPAKRGRGRPRKNPLPDPNAAPAVKRGRGRPRKTPLPEEIDEEDESDEDVNLFGLDDDNEEKSSNNNYIDDDEEDESDEDVNLFDLDDEDEEDESGEDEEDTEDDDDDSNVNLFDLDDEDEDDDTNYVREQQNKRVNIQRQMDDEYNNSILKQQTSNVDISDLLTRDKKVVSFVGTTKNGTSFVVNNLAELVSSMGISTAILDMTQSRNAYYIYTNNEERLRKICENCINNLRSNVAEGIKVNKNLTVYSPVPGTNQNIEDVGNILSTLIQNYSLVLIDCDFNTPVDYFRNSQEIYLVQSMDVLTIQPLTAFLRDLKSQNALDQNKLKIVINKEQRVGGISPKVIIGGMAYYNDPSMSFMTELFNRDNIKYVTIPLELQNYSTYLESLVNCKINLKPYTKTLNTKLRELASMVYPLIGQQYGRGSFTNNPFK